jgi:tRNA(fMet)-specific endonuclease VapC
VGILIDASILVAYERAQISSRSVESVRITGREDESIFLSVVTVSELLHGVHRARESGHRARRSAFVEAVIAQIPVLPVDVPTARVHAELWAGLATAGTPVGAHDLWIAATAVSRGLSLATANRREFMRVPGLVVEDWLQAPESPRGLADSDI